MGEYQGKLKETLVGIPTMAKNMKRMILSGLSFRKNNKDAHFRFIDFSLFHCIIRWLNNKKELNLKHDNQNVKANVKYI